MKSYDLAFDQKYSKEIPENKRISKETLVNIAVEVIIAANRAKTTTRPTVEKDLAEQMKKLDTSDKQATP